MGEGPAYPIGWANHYPIPTPLDRDHDWQAQHDEAGREAHHPLKRSVGPFRGTVRCRSNRYECSSSSATLPSGNCLLCGF